MNMDDLPKFEENRMLPPIKLTPQQEELCRRLDSLNQMAIQGQKLSMMFRGAIYGTREECRSNPDWIAQSAHSFREILFPWRTKEKEAFRSYGSVTVEEETSQNALGTVYNKMTRVAHHEPISVDDYEKLIENFQRVLLRALDRQVDIHDQIDRFLSGEQIWKMWWVIDMAKNKNQTEKVKEAKRLVNLNEDSRQYFYEKADETWLKWLWENGFFDILKKKAEDPSRFSYKMPELRYLVRMADFSPETVTEIMLDIPISGETFNPEVISQFLHICGYLPGTQLARLIGKIKSENWTALMQKYDQWGMDYGKMFESLEKSGHHKELMALANTVLELRDDWEIKAKEEYFDSTPFCLANLSYSKVFYYLSNIEEDYIEDAIDLTLSVLKKLTTSLEADQGIASVFKRKDRYPFYDVDVFTLGLRSEYHDSGQEDVREVVALVRTLTERVLAQQCKSKAKVIFEQKFESLLDSWLMWRIRLYILSLCPSELMPQLEEALFRIFEEERYPELIRGTEYQKTLKKVFPLMRKEDQDRFVNQAKELFSHTSDEGENSFIKRNGSRIFSVIAEYLSAAQITEFEAAGFKVYPGYIPTPMVSMGQVGFVKAKGPVSQEEFRNISVSTIVENLKGDWSPTRLAEQDVQRDFLNPLNAEGMGKLIEEDVKVRLQEYLEHANEFLDRENLDLHYLYSLLSGFADAIDGITKPLKNAGWDMLIAFCLTIVQSGSEQPAERLGYERNENNAWLARWNAVCHALIRFLKKILEGNAKKLGFKWKSHRQNILSIIEYLFDYPDPKSEDEQIESAKTTESVGFQNPQISDPFTIAINSIRGQAFELFVTVVQLDTENNNGSERTEIPADLKIMYEYLLSEEDTRAIMFMFGHYLPLFFYRGKNWLMSNLERIFSPEKGKEYLYLAAWEGYLTNNNLYKEIFTDEEFQKLYLRAIGLIVKDYPNQTHFINPDEGLVQHFALAYMHFNFTFGNELFDYFWESGTTDQHIAFVDRLGRSFITSENPEISKFINEDENARKKLIDMWCWLLENYTDPKVFKEIGFWVNLDKGIFKANELANFLAKTLIKTEGHLRWDVGLRENIVELAKASPNNTFKIAKLYLLEGGVRNKSNSLFFFLDEKWIDAFRILYTNPETKQSTESLINDLIHEGGSHFWQLKDVLEQS